MIKNPIKEERWVVYLLCNECNTYKEATSKNFHRNPDWILGFKSICKECCKKNWKMEITEKEIKYKERIKKLSSQNREFRDLILPLISGISKRQERIEMLLKNYIEEVNLDSNEEEWRIDSL